GRAMLDLGTDVTQIALVALAVLLGRPLRAEEFPVRRATIDLALSAWRSSLALAPWFVRALEPNAGFKSPWEALAALDGCVAGVNGAWTSRLVPDPATAEASSGKGLARMSTATRAMTRYAAIDAPTPLALPAGDAVITRRLWKINGVLTIIAAVEAICLLALLTRYSAPDQVPVPIPLAAKAGPVSPIPRLPTMNELTAELAASTRGAAQAGAAGLIDDRAAANAVGWIQVSSPVEVRVYANGRLIGSGANAKFRLPAGKHTIALVNDDRGVRTVRPVKLAPGATVMMVAEP